MNKGTKLLLSAINSFLLGAGLMAQKPAWIQGDHVVDFREAYAGDPESYPLPIPTDVGADERYNGQIAARSQYLQLDDQGKVLFFIVDGRIYDRKGYLIADNVDDVDCSECVRKGISGVAVLQVPGSCTRYYVFTTAENSSTLPYLAWASVLDLEAPNPHFSGDSNKKGRLLSYTELDLAGFDLPFDWYSTSFGGSRDVLFALNDEDYGTLHIPDCPASANNGALQVEAVDGTDGQDRFVLITSGHHISKWRCTASTLEYLGSDAITYDYDGSTEFERNRSAKGDFDAWRSADGNTIKVGLSLYSAWGVPPNHLNHVKYIEYAYDGVDLTIATQDEFGITNVPPGTYGNINGEDVLRIRVSGLEFSPNGEYLYFLASVVSSPVLQLGYIDLSIANTTWFPANFLPFIDSKIELAIGNAADGELVAYLVGYDPLLDQHRFGAYRWVDDPTAGLTYWDPDNYVLPSATDLDPGATAGDIYHLLMDQTTGDHSDQRLITPNCCASVFRVTCEEGYSAGAGAQTWTPTTNPFGNTNDIRFCADLVIPSGAYVDVHDMTLHFAPEAGLVVEPGGQIRFFNSTLTNGCPGDRWRGVEVHGHSALAQLPFTNQGYCYLYESTLENAVRGVLCATPLSGGGDSPSGYGGIVRTLRALFKNNMTDVDIRGYRPWSITSNVSKFEQTDFIVDDDWINDGLPATRVRLYRTNRVTFNNCKFRNINAVQEAGERGYGLQAFQTSFQVIGNNNPTESFQQGFFCGILAAKGRLYTVRGMHFFDNSYAMFDMAFSVGSFTGNTIVVPEAGAGASPIGLLLFQSRDYVVENNTFTSTTSNGQLGIGWLGPLRANSRIYNNSFDHLYVGSLVIGNHQSDFNPEIGLQKLCGDYQDNTIDYALGPDAYLAASQGLPLDASTLAGNRFFGTPDCSSLHDMAFDLGLPFDSYFNYHRHGSPDCDVICEDATHMSDIISPFLYSESTSCSSGIAPDGDINIVNSTQKMLISHDHLKSALDIYNGVVDKGEKQDLIEAIDEDSPWWSSHELRDLMLTHHPLSDEVLQHLLKRDIPLDPWHLTEIFVQNAPENKNLVQDLRDKELLTPYLMALVEQAQTGNGPSNKQLLEQEIHLRGNENLIARLECLRYWELDTVDLGAEDSLVTVIHTGYGLQDSVEMLLFELHRGNSMSAEALKDEEWYSSDYLKSFRDWVELYEGVDGDWLSGNGEEIEPLEQIAGSGAFGSALAWATLLEAEKWNTLPPIALPATWKLMRNAGSIKPNPVAHLPSLVLQPNPAIGHAFATYDLRLGADALEIWNPQAALLQRIDLNSEKGIVQLAIESPAAGPYLIVLMRGGVPLARETLVVVPSDQ